MKTLYAHILWVPCLLIICLASCEEGKPPSNDGPVFRKAFIDTHDGYSEAVVIQSGNLKTVYISGQVGAGKDLESQMRSALSNLEEVLGKAGATMTDVVKMNTYIVDYGPQTLASFRKVRKELLGDSDMPASTLVGVEALALPEWLIEIEAVAVVPASE
ncbi:MAG: RidA family protein [Robiginitalea sp.]|jgi:enamine deaminase RidA (YjgF/YER057c/UK114 family)